LRPGSEGLVLTDRARLRLKFGGLTDAFASLVGLRSYLDHNCHYSFMHENLMGMSY
jgi:hypothetical protein